MQRPTERHLFQHYKGGLYEKIGHSKHTETHEECVVYIDRDGKIYHRPIEMFYGYVEVNGEEIQRFKFLGSF